MITLHNFATPLKVSLQLNCFYIQGEKFCVTTPVADIKVFKGISGLCLSKKRAFLSLNIGPETLWTPAANSKVFPAYLLINWVRHAHVFKGNFKGNQCNPLYPSLSSHIPERKKLLPCLPWWCTTNIIRHSLVHCNNQMCHLNTKGYSTVLCTCS